MRHGRRYSFSQRQHKPDLRDRELAALRAVDRQEYLRRGEDLRATARGLPSACAEDLDADRLE